MSGKTELPVPDEVTSEMSGNTELALEFPETLSLAVSALEME